MFPLLPSLSREGTDGRNLCPNPSLAALALGRGDTGAEIHPGSTNFSQHLGKRAAAGTSWGREQKRTGEGGEKDLRLVRDHSIPAHVPPGCTYYLSIILQKTDSCTCFKDKETEAQRGEGRSPSRWLTVELGFQSRSVKLQKLCPLHQTPQRKEVIYAGLPPPSLSWVI